MAFGNNNLLVKRRVVGPFIPRIVIPINEYKGRYQLNQTHVTISNNNYDQILKMSHVNISNNNYDQMLKMTHVNIPVTNFKINQTIPNT